MTDRAYTVAELDALRSAVERRWLFGTTAPLNTACFSRSYNEADKYAAVEQLVRTHMLAGHTAEDIYAADLPSKDER